jgi:hypothetical protein
VFVLNVRKNPFLEVTSIWPIRPWPAKQVHAWEYGKALTKIGIHRTGVEMASLGRGCRSWKTPHFSRT